LSVRLKMWHPWHTFRNPINCTDVAWYWNQRYQCQETVQIFRWRWPLAVLTHYSTHTPTVICLLIRNYKLSIQHP
jgi:hypothetical protein